MGITQIFLTCFDTGKKETYWLSLGTLKQKVKLEARNVASGGTKLIEKSKITPEKEKDQKENRK